MLQNGSPRDTVGSVPPENLCKEVTLGALNLESMVSDCGMTVVSAESDLETLTDDPKLTTEMENNNIPDNIPEPQHSETIEGASSVSGDDAGQGVLSLSNEGDMGTLQATDTEASLEAEHIPLPIQLHPNPTWIAKELPPPVHPPLPLEPEPDMQSISTNQDLLELQAASSLETALFREASVSQSATPETRRHISHPPLEEPALCARGHCELLDAPNASPAITQEAEQPGPHFEIPNVTSWPKLHFPSSAADYGKSLSSFFSSPSSTGSRAAETGLMSSFKKLSTLFEGGSEGKGSSVMASDSKLRFGKKLDLSFPWPRDNKGDSEQMPAESSSSALIIISDQDLKSGETDKTLQSSQMSGASAEPAKVLTQPSETSEQLEAGPSICTQELSRPGEVENQQEIPASGEDGDTKDNLSDAICPSESHEEEHCTVSELLQSETHEEEAEPASIGSVSDVQRLDIKEPKTSKRPVLN